jgi:DNA replication and checkpoint protein
MENLSKLVPECHELRAQLKEWEKWFAETNSGRKPGKEDIRENPEIAAKYKLYNRTRDILDGKKTAESLHRSSPPMRRQKSASWKRTEQDHGQSPKRTRFTTPRKAQPSLLESHPSILDAYDAPPPSVSPHPYVFKNAVGPTPQRDGKCLGLFDLLSSSGSMPSTRKRKADVLDNQQNGLNVAQTPSRKSTKATENLLQHPAEYSGGRRHTRTPASDGKKFLLSQFFATPSTTRFATLAEEPHDVITQTRLDKTPLRSRVLGNEVRDGVQLGNALETTPTYLKRTTSFNQRLLTASSSNRQPTDSSSNLVFVSPSAVRTGPKMHQYKGKGLSEILRGLRQMEDHEDEDEMDALREIEGNDRNVLVGDSQDASERPNVGEEQTRTWKKKGQKRSTRRVIMRPTPAARGPRSGKDDEFMLENDVTNVHEAQPIAHMTQSVAEDGSDAGNLEPLVEDEGDNADIFNHVDVPSDFDDELFESDPDLDELVLTPPTKKLRFHPAPEADARPSTAALRKASRKEAQPAGKKEKKKNNKGIINPNANSHQNFRSLKIRNKNSKGKGSGRFGRGRR